MIKKTYFKFLIEEIFLVGHLSPDGNKDLIYSYKPNNIGLFLGTILDFNLNKGYITLKLNEPIEIGDTISIESEHGVYTISEILETSYVTSNTFVNHNTKFNEDIKSNTKFKISSKNIKASESNYLVTIGRMKGKLKKGLKIYKMSSKKLDILSESSYHNSEYKKIPLKCDMKIKLGEPIKISVSTFNAYNSFYNNISFEIISDIIPESSINAPISIDRIKSQIDKTNNTPYKFEEINIDLEQNLFIPHISDINNLRRKCIEKLEQIIISKYCSKHLSINNLSLIDTTNMLDDTKCNNNIIHQNTHKISILLNKLNLKFDYNSIHNVSKIYIPLKYFVNEQYSEIISDLSKISDIYVYLPIIMKKNYCNILNTNLNKILQRYNIKGFVISNLGNLNMLKNLDHTYNLIGNYSLNVFNSETLKKLNNFGIHTVTLSPELSENDINAFKNYNAELIVYGNIPLMNINYCPLSRSNKCFKNCKKLCTTESKFYLIDRLNFKFEIIPDNIDCITSIYNSKILSIFPPKEVKNLRLDFMHEKIEEINSIIDTVVSGKRLEGTTYTNGNWHRDEY